MLTPRELIFVCRQIASALDYVHSMVGGDKPTRGQT